ncbi:MAG: dihydroneopterin aldolase [Rickettsiaceae bacterium H1]|nr:dihydroneopterin aldolase [Rickettsiaceae bacterium H1]
MLLRINDFKVQAKIGDYSWEKVITQKIIINLEIEMNKVIDYCLIAKYVKEFVIKEHYNFIEELARSLSDGLKKEFLVTKTKLEIKKMSCIVASVTILD